MLTFCHQIRTLSNQLSGDGLTLLHPSQVECDTLVEIIDYSINT